MVRHGRASTPMDLLSYTWSDGQPSIFYLKESSRQSILTVFNWTDHITEHAIGVADLGIPVSAHCIVTDVLERKTPAQQASPAIHIQLPPHSVRVLKIVDQDVPVQPPVVTVNDPATGNAGDSLGFSAQQTSGDPVLSYRWDFGDGVQMEGLRVSHDWTQPGDCEVVPHKRALSSSITAVDAPNRNRLTTFQSLES